ncbi:MAG TPA: hypothetical protein VJK04_01900 [Candidatus Paceibacterota bacterium]
MPLCGFNATMLKGLTLFAQGLYEQAVKRSENDGVDVKTAMEIEVHEMNVFLPALDEEYEELRKTQGVDESMRNLVQWTKQHKKEK